MSACLRLPACLCLIECLRACLSIFLSWLSGGPPAWPLSSLVGCLPVCLFVCLSVSVCYIYSAWLRFKLLVCSSVSACRPVCLSVCLPVSVCLSVCLACSFWWGVFALRARWPFLCVGSVFLLGLFACVASLRGLALGARWLFVCVCLLAPFGRFGPARVSAAFARICLERFLACIVVSCCLRLRALICLCLPPCPFVFLRLFVLVCLCVSMNSLPSAALACDVFRLLVCRLVWVCLFSC